jgi:hypothetical protein
LWAWRGKTLRTLFCRNFQRPLAKTEVVSAELSKRRLRMKYWTRNLINSRSLSGLSVRLKTGPFSRRTGDK